MNDLLSRGGIEPPHVYLLEKSLAGQPDWWRDAVTEGGTRLPPLVLAECRDPGTVLAEVPLHYAVAKLLVHHGCRIGEGGLLGHPQRLVYYSAGTYG